MWKCRNCGAEVMQYWTLTQGLMRGKVDKKGYSITDEIVDYDVGDIYYKCPKCKEKNERKEELAVWVEEE